MLRYLVFRLLQALVVLLLLSAATYGLLGLMPGDPIDLMVGADPRITSADIARLKALQGLDLPLWERYLNWLTAALQGDLGYSRLYTQPVLDIVAERMPRTLLLIGLALILALAVAIPAAVVAARNPGGAVDRGVNLLCFVGISVPAFWLALILIILFAVVLGWLPAGGTVGAQGGGVADRAAHLVLPVATLAAASVAAYTRHLRAALIEALGEDYVRTARAKGLSERVVTTRHALRNALLPVVTLLGLDLGSLVSGALVTETMFAQPGMGKTIYDAVMGNDYNLALVGLLVAAAATLLGNLGADLAYARLDPRIVYRTDPAT
ncbi:MAG: ABC transporter permease [Thalassobaculum sp.]|uniref:ABC transporter permease n=1 Tax=Thalassobaculum sp. TaxID=2022740 RepID=UPI0032F099FD